MRGWKVRYSSSERRITVGPSRGRQLTVRVVGIGCGAGGRGYKYLAYEIEGGDDNSELDLRYEAALLDFLNKRYGGTWDLIPASVLNRSWDDMTLREKKRILLRDGFEVDVGLEDIT